MKSIFTISLDFELHWGGFEKWPLQPGQPGLEGDYSTCFLHTRKVIPEILKSFAASGVHATWASVGMLFHDTKKELLANAPEQKPGYLAQNLSAYQYISARGIGDDEQSDPFHFAPSLVAKIIATPDQELGTHTFAHFYCNEPGQTPDQFREDLRAAQRAAAKFGKKLRSLVFPRNQFNDHYLRVCFEEGITSVRSNPRDWFWNIGSTQREPALKRLNRGLDAYFPIGKKNTYRLSSIEVRPGFPVCLPASRLLRPYRPGEFFLNDLKVNRVKAEMTRAAENNEVYHLWWHPHNFGHYPEQSMEGLEKILRHFEYCRDKFGMRPLTMSESTDLILNPDKTDD